VRVERARTVAAPPEAVWALVADPHRLPAWWPRVERVEGVVESGWTSVLRSPRGQVVRADQRLTASEAPRRRAWEQALADTPFERLLRESATEVVLAPDGDGTSVTLAARRRLRGLNRLGTPLLGRAMARELDQALESLSELLLW
jgi:uncharacterized protein YndB with AHSA1/START domain